MEGCGSQSPPLHYRKSAGWVHCLPLWQDTHIFECQHNASDNPSDHQHNPQDTEEACTRGEVHLEKREEKDL